MKNKLSKHFYSTPLALLLTAAPIAAISCPNGQTVSNTCSGCHFGGSFSYNLLLSAGSTVLERGDTTTVTITMDKSSGSNATDLGYALSTDGGSFTAGSGSTLLSSDVTHSVPRASNGSGDTSWSVTFNAPAGSSGSFTLSGIGNPVDGNRTSDVSCSDFTGTSGDGPWPTNTLGITVNDQPSISAGGGSASYSEGSAVAVAPSLTISDTENDNMQSATVSITTNYNAGDGDRLNISASTCTTNGLSCSGSGTQTITISGGPETIGEFRNVFRAITFDNTSDTPSTATRAVQFSLTDTHGRTVNSSRNVTVTAVNDAPNITGGTVTITAENEGSALSGVSVASAFTDPEGNGMTFALSSGSLPTGVSLTSGTGALTGTPTVPATYTFAVIATDNGSPNEASSPQSFSFTINEAVNDTPQITGGTVTLTAADEGSALSGVSVASNFSDEEGNNLNYAVTSGSLPTGVSLTTGTGALTGTPTVPAIYSFSVTATETNGSPSNLSSSAQAYSFTINEAVNDNPQATGGTIALSAVNENAALSGVSVSSDFSDEEGNNLNFAVTSGSLPTGVSLTTGTGALTGTPTVPGAYSFSITATETNGSPSNLSSAAQAYSWTVNNANDTPVVSTNTGLTILELTTANIPNTQLSTSDADNAEGFGDGPSIITYTLVTPPSDGTLNLLGSALSATQTFTQQDIDSGNLSYTQTAGIAGGNDSFVFDVEDDDNAGPSGVTFNITVTGNTPPVITAGGTLNYSENNPATAVDTSITVSDSEGDNITGATVQITGNYASSEDVLSVATQLGISGTWVSGTGILTLTGTTTVANYQTVLRTVSYNNTSEDPSNLARTLSWRVTDINNSNTVTSTVNVAKQNDLPTSSNPTININEDTPRALLVADFPFSDVDAADSLSQIRITQVPAAGSLVNNVTPVSDNDVIVAADLAGNLVFTPANNENGSPYATLNFQVHDGTGFSTATHTMTINVGADNDAPTTVGGTVTLSAITENAALSGVDVTAGFNDAESNDLDYALTSGALPPGVTLATASGALNGAATLFGTFNFGITATETNGNPTNLSSAEQAFTITVNNVNDAPQAVGGTIALMDETAGAVIVAGNDVTAGFTDEESNTLNYALSTGTLPDGVTINASSGDLQGTPTTWGAFSFTVVATETDAAPNLSSAAQSFSLTVNIIDIDADTVPDFLDNCPNDSNTDQLDTDTDGSGDVCDNDDDGDGMPDTFENSNGFDPLDPNDAGLDADGDGVTNLQEFINGSNPTSDDAPPVFSGADDITTNATGFLTPVVFTVTAVDVVDGPVAVSITSVSGATSLSDAQAGTFRSGLTTITYTASDTSGNSDTVNQNIIVRPLASIMADRSVAEGSLLNIDVILSGLAPAYPVMLNYTVSGTANSADHDAVAGTLVINSGLQGSISVNIANDALTEADETLIVTLSSAQNAALSSRVQFTATIVEGNLAPELDLSVAQGAINGPLVTTDQGNIVITANVTDPNAGDTFSYDWSASDSNLQAINGSGTSSSTTFELDPVSLLPGVYAVVLTVTDSGSLSDSSLLLLNVKATAVVLVAVDTDGDGVNDDIEGYQDVDADGIPDHLDAFNQPGTENLINNQTGNLAVANVMEAEPGVGIRLGRIALEVGAVGIQVSQDDLQVFADDNGATPELAQDTHTNIGGVYDFELYGIAPGAAARIVIPLQSSLFVNSVYRKFDINDGWRDFVIDANNSVYSATSINGACPGPNDSAYVEGLTAFDDCVLLILQDGGPNDEDGVADGVIRDPSGPAFLESTADNNADTTVDDGSSGGGLVYWFELIALLGLCGMQRRCAVR